METRRLGQSDLDVSHVILGTWAIGGSMWGGQDEARSMDAIRASIDAGVSTIDTAPVYGLGRSEEIVGKAIEGRRDKVIIATKCGLSWDTSAGTHKFDMVDVDGRKRPVHNDMSKAAVRAGCEASLRRLRIDCIDLFQIHWPDPGLPIDDHFGELLALRDEGKIRHIGVSNFSLPQLDRGRALAPIVSHQPQYNLLERGIEQEVLPWCRAHDVGVIVYSPMARGLLTGRISASQTFAPNDHRAGVRWFAPEARAKTLAALDRARPIAEAHGVSLGNLAVAWALAQPGVTAALVGARDAAQATENARAASVVLRPDEVEALGRLFA